jgi:hypothetical protein
MVNIARMAKQKGWRYNSSSSALFIIGSSAGKPNGLSFHHWYRSKEYNGKF